MTASRTASGFTYTRPLLARYQLDALFCRERYAVVEASTKAGKTTACIVWIAEQAMASKAGRNFWWVAPIFPQAKIAFRRLKRGLPEQVYTANESELTLTLVNGAIIWFKSADKADSLYGEDVYGAVLDEASRMREDSWIAVRSTLTATRGAIRIIGNVKGRRNWAYQLARRAESGERDMHYAKITAKDAIAVGIIAADEVEDARQKLPAAVFQELYEAIPSDDGGNPFGLDAILASIGELSSAAPVVWGWDLAKSVDWTVGVALDKAGRVCRLERWQGPWETTITRIWQEVQHIPSLVDSTGVGDAVLESLQKGHGNFEGFKFSPSSKQQLMEGLALWLQQRQGTIPDGVLVNELETFEYVYSRTGVRYSAPVGLHDDCVCALALAVRHSTASQADARVLSVMDRTPRRTSGW